MPNRIEHIPPEVFLTYKGVTVYHAYKNDDIDLRLTYWFTTDKDEEPGFEFDIRDLARSLLGQGLLKQLRLEKDSDFHAVLKLAVEHQLLADPGDAGSVQSNH